MAGKNRGSDNGGGQSNRFRFVMIEGELSDNNMGALAQAITSALRPAPATAPRLPARTAPSLATGNGAVEEPEEIDADAEEIEPEEPATVRAPRKATGPRKPVKREIVKDVDLTAGDVPFEEFMKSKGSPAETSKRFLVVAAWFNKYGGVGQITGDHVYTAYRGIGLNLDVKDIGQIFRDLKGQGWGDYKDRKFEINQIGLGVVNRMQPASEPA